MRIPLQIWRLVPHGPQSLDDYSDIEPCAQPAPAATRPRSSSRAPPLTLGFVLGRMMEESLRQALIISRGNPMTFVEWPISAVLLIVAVLMLAIAILPKIRQGRDAVFVE